MVEAFRASYRAVLDDATEITLTKADEPGMVDVVVCDGEGDVAHFCVGVDVLMEMATRAAGVNKGGLDLDS